MTRIGRHDKKLKTMFWKYIYYDTYNTTLQHIYRLGMLNSNMVNSKFHFIQSFC